MKPNYLGCPIGTYPGNCVQSLPSNRVVLSIATEQLDSNTLLVLPTEFVLGNHRSKQQ